MDYLTGNEELDAALEKQVAGLPPALQNLLNSDHIDTFSHALAEKFALTEEEEESVMHEIALIVLTIMPVDTFLVNLISEALIAPDIAERIVEETKNTLFASVADDLKVRAPEVAAASVTPIPTTPPYIPDVQPLEKPYIETPVRKAAYETLLGAPRYGVETAPTQQPQTVPVADIPLTPPLRVIPITAPPIYAAPVLPPRAPQKGLLPPTPETPPHGE